MTDRIVSEDREAALISLIDDPSPTVQKALIGEFRRLKDVGVSILRQSLRELDGTARHSAQQLLMQVQGPDPVAEVSCFIQSLQWELQSGLILYNRVIQPDLQAGMIMEQLDLIAGRANELMVRPSPIWERCKVLNRVIFHEFGFRGNTEDYDDPLNSFIFPVLKRRKGIPISLSAIYILVAQRCGIELEPVSVPGHFLVGCFLEGTPFYIDAFQRGRLISGDELRRHLETAHPSVGAGVMAPSPVGEVLCRICRNLARHYTLKNNPRMARIFSGFIQEFEETYRRHSQA